MPSLGARIVVAGTHSGVGKTTVATGLMAALRRRGLEAGSAKVGPDFIDPGYHRLATGRAPRNLDPWISGAHAIPALAGRAADGVDVLVIEGVMGLFDGAGDGTPSSTADVARALGAPVLLVVDASAMSQSVAALVHGFTTLDPHVDVAGVVFNRIGSPAHEAMLRDALAGLSTPVLGALHRDDRFAWRERHLGLVPVAEHPAEVEAAIDRLAAAITERLDLDGIVRLASGASGRSVPEPPLPDRVGAAQIAVAAGPAFSFCYPDNLEALAAAGAELVPFDPCKDRAVPDGCSGLLLGGGFPEVFGAQLAGNRPLLDEVRRRAGRDLAVWAECGGLLWLSQSLDGRPMAGVLDTATRMTDRLTLGYRTARTAVATPLGPPDTEVRGHEFHYSSASPAGEALHVAGYRGAAPQGFGGPRLLASYVHAHLGSAPDLAAAFVACARGAAGGA
jgi:cobyrinic acid a,c-diamide synthase